MKRVYHKGRYRHREWAKHLRPYLKQQGNKRWRKTATNEIDEQLDTDQPNSTRRRSLTRKNSQRILVQLTLMENGRKSKWTKRYHSMRDVQNAIKRNAVVSAYLLDTQEQIKPARKRDR